MSLARISSAQVQLLEAKDVEVEVDISDGLYAFSVVGLPDKAVEESRDRVSAAIKNSGYSSPKQENHKVVVSLAPASLKKEGSVFDCAIALAYLLAAKEISFPTEGKLICGELALDGSVRPIKGSLTLAVHARKKGYKQIFVPTQNAKEAALMSGVEVYGVSTFSELINHLSGQKKLKPELKPSIKSFQKKDPVLIDLSDIKGQEAAKRALEIAAVGRHNIAMSGPPGTGKTMLAQALRSILPPLTFKEILECTAIHSVAGETFGNLITERPFRTPHHTASYTSVIGGGSTPKPGEATLAHRGVLFLDEFPEFERRVMESLRQPLESKEIHISRSGGQAHFPANFTLVAAMNPCPCGNYGVEGKRCRCTPHQLNLYARRLSGPIIDRIDIWTKVSEIDHKSLSDYSKSGEDSKTVQNRVLKALKRAVKRGQKQPNSLLGSREIMEKGGVSSEAKRFLEETSKFYDLSARSFYKVAKIARTIADLEGSGGVEKNHVSEAIQYRPQVDA